jgi:DNA-binding CsgD family transcriptional regulator
VPNLRGYSGPFLVTYVLRMTTPFPGIGVKHRPAFGLGDSNSGDGFGERHRDGSKKMVPEKVLTKREREVLKLLSEGLHYKEIGQAMKISTETVRHYAKSIYKKLCVTSRTEAAVAYVKSQAIRE